MLTEKYKKNKIFLQKIVVIKNHHWLKNNRLSLFIKFQNLKLINSKYKREIMQYVNNKKKLEFKHRVKII